MVLDADPENYNQPLTRWDHVWRTLLCLVISTIAWWEYAGPQWNDYRLWFWSDLGIGLASYVLVFYRRRWPFLVAVLLSIAGVVSLSAAGPGILAAVSLATRRKLPQIVVVGLAGIIAGQPFAYYQPVRINDDSPWLNFTMLVVITIAMSVFGMYLGSRRELLWTLQERARQAESEQELRVGQARSAERERIAREMHDVLAHRISLVTMHAGALAYRTDLPPEQIRETAKLIQEKAHEALTDLRQVLGVLRSQDHAEIRPQPTLPDLPALLEEATVSGMVIESVLDLDGSEPVGDQTGRTIYRVVQEALTNVRKHAPGTHVRVNLSGDQDSGITVVVRNATRVGTLGILPPPGAGLGLIGLRERAALAGGTLEVSRTAEAYSLRCWLPWTPGATPLTPTSQTAQS